MAAESNYGSTFTKGGSAPAPAIVVDFPELSMGKLNATTHASGGETDYIPSGLLDAGDITLSLMLETGDLAAMKTDMAAGTVSSVVVSNGLDTMTGSGFYTSIKPEGADAQNPDIVKATVVVAFTGGITLS